VTEIQPVLNLRERLRRILLRTVLSVVAVAVLTFLADLAVFRIRVWIHRNPYGSVMVTHYYAVPQKNGKTQFIFDPAQPWTCVNALFPHGGSLPCWYLQKHPEQRTDI
jgi:hypothetical protein